LQHVGVLAHGFVLFIQQKTIECRESIVSSGLVLSAGQPAEDGQLKLRLRRLATSDQAEIVAPLSYLVSVWRPLGPNQLL